MAASPRTGVNAPRLKTVKGRTRRGTNLTKRPRDRLRALALQRTIVQKGRDFFTP